MLFLQSRHDIPTSTPVVRFYAHGQGETRSSTGVSGSGSHGRSTAGTSTTSTERGRNVVNAGQVAARWRIRQLHRNVRAGMIRVRKSRFAVAALATADEVRVRFGDGRPTVADVRAIGTAVAVATGPRHDPRTRRVRFAGRGLTIVNAVTFTVLIAHLSGFDASHPDPGLLLVAGTLAVCCTTAQAVLAIDLGRRLRLHPAPRPLRPAIVGAGLLALTAGLAAAASSEWAQRTGSGGLGVAAGLLLGASALAAPFVLVADQVYGPGPEAGLLSRAERILARRDRRCRRLERRAARHLCAAERLLWRAEDALATVADQLGRDHPLVDVLTEAVTRLRTELEATRPEGARPEDPEPVDPLDPDDLDLAG